MAPDPVRIPEPLLAEPFLTLAPISPPWLAALRRRRWLAAPAVLAVIVTIGLLLGRRPSATPGVSSAPPAKVLPDSPNRIAAAERPSAGKDAAPSTGGSPAATGHAKADARAHAAQRTHRQKKRFARPGRGKHTRVVALEKAAAPKVAGDERSARDSYERGNQRLLTGDTAGAVAAYEEAVRSAPSSPSGYRGLGLAYEKQGKIAEAVRAFRHYLQLAPSSADRDLVTRRLRHLLRLSP
jgi:tetratricopeptide (TPR) repeat protein